MKRANGSGSVYKLSGKRRRPWVAAKTERAEDGSLHKIIIGYYATKREAEAGLALNSIRPSSAYANVTLKQLWEMWIATKAYTRLSPQGQRYNRAGFNHLKPLHDKKYADLRRDHFQAMIDAAEEAGKSRSTLSEIRSVCTLLGEYASALDVVPKSYATKLLIPRKERKAVETFSDEDIDLLFKNADLPWADTVLILIYTGMRITEFLTLKKDDVDIESMLIVGGVKTDAGRDRTIPIHPRIEGFIRARYEASTKYLIEANGRMIRDDTYRTKYYYPLLESLGIRKMSPHKARHTFFTRFDAVCSDKLAMALIGGHTDPNFSEKVYVHPDIERLRAAISQIK